MTPPRFTFSILCSLVLLLSGASRAWAFTELYASVSNTHDSDPPSGILKINAQGVATVWNIDWGTSGVSLQNPQGLAFDTSGNLYIHDMGYIYKVSPQGLGSIFAMKPETYNTYGLAVDTFGNVYATGSRDFFSVIYHYDSSGALTATWSGVANGLEIGPDGALYTADDMSGIIWRYDTTTGTRTSYASVSGATDLSFDPEGNLFVTNLGNRVYKVANDAEHTVTTFISSKGLNYTTGITVDPANNDLYIGNMIGISSSDNQVRLGLSGTSILFTDLTANQRVNFLAMKPVPEPSICLLLLGGLGVSVWAVMRSRKPPLFR